MADGPVFPHTPRPLRGLFSPLVSSAAGMSQQQRFLETIARNLANAQTTRTAEGGAYKREVTIADGGRTVTYQDGSEGDLVYLPNHPDADAKGYVRMPNVDPQQEMVDMLVARRLHEANATAFTAAKRMLQRAIDI
ncbi:MAG: flagellar basal body rod C-terminal domain-containing protein [Gemmatimonadales bacterium]|nr:flagellar basal body rod C-terminal domain-containing protein [Gemmatimonadales bacterium]